MSKCYIVVHRNYADGTDAYAFHSEEKARESVKQDVETEMKSLRARGYDPVDMWDALGNPEIFVRDTDIYYEWMIFESTIV